MDSQFWLWLDTILMVAGGVVILAIGKQRTSGEQSHTIYHGVVPVIAACSYLAMAVGQGVMTLHNATPGNPARLFYFARYVDWTFTTPLLLLSLAHTAMHSGMRKSGMVAGLLISDVIMILTSLFFGASEVIWIKWTWYLASCVAFLAVYYVIWGPMLRENKLESAQAQSNYRRSAVILSVLWLIYPLILAVCPDGLGVLGDTPSVAFIAILDLISKMAYGLLAIVATTRLVTSDLVSRPAHTAERLAAE